MEFGILPGSVFVASEVVSTLGKETAPRVDAAPPARPSSVVEAITPEALSSISVTPTEIDIAAGVELATAAVYPNDLLSEANNSSTGVIVAFSTVFSEETSVLERASAVLAGVKTPVRLITTASAFDGSSRFFLPLVTVVQNSCVLSEGGTNDQWFLNSPDEGAASASKRGMMFGFAPPIG